jgi:hypothetical protein
MRSNRLIETSLLFACVFLVGCRPNPKATLGSVSEKYGASTTGLFNHAMVIPVSGAGKTAELYIQNATAAPTAAAIDAKSAYCVAEISAVKFSRPELVAKIDVSSVKLPQYTSMIHQNGANYPVTVNVSRKGSAFAFDIAMSAEVPYIGTDYVNIVGSFRCTRGSSDGKFSDQTSAMTAGELIEIFGFHYVWLAPSV